MLGGRTHHAIAVPLPCQIAVLQLQHRSCSLDTIDSEIYGHCGLAGGTSCRRSELGLAAGRQKTRQFHDASPSSSPLRHTVWWRSKMDDEVDWSPEKENEYSVSLSLPHSGVGLTPVAPLPVPEEVGQSSWV